MDNLTEQKIRQMMQDEIARYMNAKQFTLSKIPAHEHSGTGFDATKISEKNIIHNDKYTTFLTVSNTGATPVTVDTLKSISNLNSIKFFGYTANNASGAATKRAIINGEIQFGKSYGTDGLSKINANAVTSNNYMYVDSTNLANNRVGAQNGMFGDIAITFSGSLAIGATSATLSSNWTRTTGAYNVVFSNNEIRSVLFTNGSSSVTWNGGLVATATSSANIQSNIIAIAFDETGVGLCLVKVNYTGSDVIFTTYLLSGQTLNGGLLFT